MSEQNKLEEREEVFAQVLRKRFFLSTPFTCAYVNLHIYVLVCICAIKSEEKRFEFDASKWKPTLIWTFIIFVLVYVCAEITLVLPHSPSASTKHIFAIASSSNIMTFISRKWQFTRVYYSIRLLIYLIHSCKFINVKFCAIYAQILFFLQWNVWWREGGA